MAPLKATVPLPSRARVCLPAGALTGRVPLPTAVPRDHLWDEGTSCLAAISHAAAPLHMPGSWLGRRSQEISVGLRRESILSWVHCCLCLGSTERCLGLLYLLSLLSAPPEGASFAQGRQRGSTPLLADLGWDALHLASSWNFTWISDKTPHISAGLPSSSVWNLASVCWLHFWDPAEQLLEMGWGWTGALPQIWQKTLAGSSRVAIRVFL